MKVGQTIRRPALFEIKEQYGGFFDLLDKHIKDDEQLTKIFEQIFISLEWHSLFLKRINKDAGGNLSKNEQEREYRRFAKEVEKAISKVQAYLPIHDQIKLPEDKGTIIISLEEELVRLNKDTTETQYIISKLKDMFDIKRVRENKRYKTKKANSEAFKEIKEALQKNPCK